MFKVFRKFHLNAIGNRMDGMEIPNIDFSVYSYPGLLFPGYSYGFYRILLQNRKDNAELAVL